MSKVYEYRTEEISHMAEHQSTLTTDVSIDVEALNDMSKTGWQLVCTTPTQLIFKRRIK